MGTASPPALGKSGTPYCCFRCCCWDAKFGCNHRAKRRRWRCGRGGGSTAGCGVIAAGGVEDGGGGMGSASGWGCDWGGDRGKAIQVGWCEELNRFCVVRLFYLVTLRDPSPSHCSFGARHVFTSTPRGGIISANELEWQDWHRYAFFVFVLSSCVQQRQSYASPWPNVR